MSEDRAVKALAELCHRCFVGLQLRVAVEAGRAALDDWMFRLFRAQHEIRFLSGLAKLGLDGLPHAIACARYHVLSNAIGGVVVEYMEESERKAWIRFRYPRWIHDGPALAAMPVEASRGLLRGWYARNGISLDNPRLGFVCVSEDMAGWGLCGYFVEEDRPLADDSRLRFAPDELPPPFDPAAQPRPPAADWDAARLAKAERNYALEYLRNGLPTLAAALGRDWAMEIARPAARLAGLQSWRDLAAATGAPDADTAAAARMLAALLAGMGDVTESADAEVRQQGLRVARGIEGAARDDLLSIWAELWRGVIEAHRTLMTVSVDWFDDGALWRIHPRTR